MLPTVEELNCIAAEYDMAIRQYEAFYSQEASAYDFPAYAQTAYAESNAECTAYPAQLALCYDDALAQYEEQLCALEQIRPCFVTSQQYLGCLEGDEREKYLKEWEDYLREALETARQLVIGLEGSINFITEELEHKSVP